MSSIFNEKNMIAAISKQLPQGQTFKAGIHAIVKKAELTRVYANASLDSTGTMIEPNPEVPLLLLMKEKYCTFDVYIGFSEDYLVIVPCEEEKWYYKHNEITDPKHVAEFGWVATGIDSAIHISDILPVYRISDIDKCEIKKNWIGAYICKMEFKNADRMQVLLPPLAGLFGGMPNHSSYRKAILDMLQQHRGE